MPAIAIVPTPFATPSDEEIERRFLDVYAEIQSRAKRIARSFRRRDQEDVEAEVVAAAWINFQQAARAGRWLNGTQLGWASWNFVRSRRSAAGGNTVTDVMSPMAQLRGRAKVLSFGSFERPHIEREHAVVDDRRLRKDYERAITGRWRETPLQRAQVRVDWVAFSKSLRPNLRTILYGLSRGDQKTEIANRLSLSNGRISQLVNELQVAVWWFFAGNIPAQF